MPHTTGYNINSLYQVKICRCFLESSKTMLNNCFIYLIVERVLCKPNFHSCFILARLHMSKIHLFGRRVDTCIRQEFVTDL